MGQLYIRGAVARHARTVVAFRATAPRRDKRICAKKGGATAGTTPVAGGVGRPQSGPWPPRVGGDARHRPRGACGGGGRGGTDVKPAERRRGGRDGRAGKGRGGHHTWREAAVRIVVETRSVAPGGVQPRGAAGINRACLRGVRPANIQKKNGRCYPPVVSMA